MDWNWTLSNTNYRSALLLLVAGNALCVAMAQTGGASVVALTPPEMKWTKQGALAAPGLEQFNLVGDPTKPGPYTLRLKFPKGYRIAPHTHPDSREVTIISGVFATGYGETFDNARLKTCRPVASTPSLPMFRTISRSRKTLSCKVSGMGPSGRKFINLPETPK
jgi:hypothetical protein